MLYIKYKSSVLLPLLLCACLRAQVPVQNPARVFDNPLGQFLTATPDSGCLVIGKINSDAILVKLNSQWDNPWCKTVGQGMDVNDLVAGYDTSYYAAGSWFPASDSALVMKLNKSGGLAWARALSFSGAQKVMPAAIDVTSDSGMVLCGYATFSTKMAFVARFTKGGLLLWSKLYGADSVSATGNSIKQLPDSGYILLNGSQYLGLTRLDKNGAVLWCNRYSQSNNLRAMGYVMFTASNLYVLGGELANQESFLMKTDLLGNVLFAKRYITAFPYYAFPQKPLQLPDGGFYLPTSSSPGFLNMQKVDSAGMPQWCWFAETMEAGATALLANGRCALVANGPLLGSRAPASFPPEMLALAFDPQDSLTGKDCVTRSRFFASDSAFTALPLGYTAAVSGSARVTGLAIGPTIFVNRVGCLDVVGGFETYSGAAGISVYPNPATEKITITCGQALPGPVHYSILDVCGRAVITESASSYQPQHILDCGGLSPGAYLLQMTAPGQQAKTAKLLISR